MAFTHCGAEIKALMKVSDEDVTLIEDKLAERLALGEPRAAAQRHAVADAIAMLAEERATLMDAIFKKIGAPKKVAVSDKPKSTDDVKFSASDAPTKPVGNWYSELTRQIESSKTNAMPAGMWSSWINSLKGVKADEIEWSGVQDWLKLQTGKVSKADVSNYLNQNGVQVQETVLTNEGHAYQVRANSNQGGWEVRDPDGNWWGGYATEAQAKAAGYNDTPENPPKYSQYQLPGGTNYREVLLTLPEKGKKPYSEWLRDEFGKGDNDTPTAREMYAAVTGEVTQSYKSSHWEQPNVLAHIRVNDRTDADGKRVLFVEEIQSDWGQEGKKKGFASSASATVTVEKVGKSYNTMVDGQLHGTAYSLEAAEAQAAQIRAEGRSKDGVPTAPFVTATDKWLSLALKRIVKMAVDGGYDKVAFVNGEQSADRYDLSKQVESIRYEKEMVNEWSVAASAVNKAVRDGLSQVEINKLREIRTDLADRRNEKGSHNGKYALTVLGKSGEKIFNEDSIAIDRIEELVGKDIAKKIAESKRTVGILKDTELKVGGEGMKAFYDKIVPNTTKEVIRKLGGGQMESIRFTDANEMAETRARIGSGDDGTLAAKMANQQPGFTITPAMKDKAAGGMALFSVADKTEYTPTNGTEPASDQQQALADDLARRINNGAGRDRAVPTVLHAVNAGSGSDADLRRTVAATRTFSKSIFGHTAVFVDFEGETLFRGAMSDAIPDTIFLDIKSDKPHMAVLGHELLHQLRKTAPDIYERLNERLNQVLKPDALNTYSKALIAKYEAKGLKAPTNIDEELTGDIVGDNFNDPEFLKLLGENQPAGFRKVLDSIAKFLDDVLAKLTGKNRPFGTDQYLTDIKAARQAVVTAMREFSGSQVGAMTNERVTDDVKFSSNKPLQTETKAFRDWFKDSAVVDDEGKPLVVYHGTANEFDAFDNAKTGTNDKGLWGRGHYLSATVDGPNSYALRQGDGARVIAAYVAIRNPLVLRTGSDLVTRMPDGTNTRDLIGPNLDGSKIKAIAMNEGRDGVIQIKPNGAIGDVVAFEPNQIKSATGNNGDFNASNPDIRFSVSNQNEVPTETKWQGRQRVVQDKFNRFKVLQNWLTEKGIDLSEGADVYQAETLMSGRIASRKEDFREKQMQPLIQKTQKAGVSMEDMGDYLKAQHAPEANKRAQEIHNDPTATAFGVTDAEAKATIDEFKKQANFTELKDLANEWRDITTQTKQILLDGGILSKDMVAAWDATYSAYIPVKGSEESQGTGKGLSVNGKTKRRMGHGLRDEAILENILRDHERAIQLDEKNNVGKALIRFALEAKNDDIITVGQPEKRQIMKAGEVMLQASPMLAENEVNVYVNGHAVRVQINDEVAARAYTALGVEHLNAVLSAARDVNTMLSKAYTGYSPDFILTNPIRDAIQGSMTLTGEYGAGTAAKIFTHYPKAVKELVKHFNNHGSSKLVNDYRANGGSTGASYLSDLERIGNDMQASYDEYAGAMATYSSAYKKAMAEGKKAPHMYAAMRSSLAGIKKVPVVGHFLRLMESMNAITENALRVATYDTLVKDGISPSKAAAQAKNLMNFNRKGEISNTAGALYLFFNPSVQGSQVMFKALVESKHKGQVQALAGMMVLSAMALAELAMSGGADDEEKWKNTPDYVKDGNMVVGVGDKQFTLTLPYGYRIFHTLGNVISEYMHGGDGYKLGIRLASSVFANLSPVGNPMEGNVQGFSVMPTLPKMLLGPSVNQDSFGREIAPKSWSNNKPDSQIMNRNTRNTAYSSMAKGMNDLTGGTDYKKGLIDVSPETLKYWVNSLTGGAGKFAVDTIQGPYKVSQGVDLDVKDIPIIRRFVRETGVSDTRSAFWERAKEAKEAADAFAAAKKAHDNAGIQDIAKNQGALLSMAKYAEEVQKMVKAKRDETDRINADKMLTLKQKQEKVKLVEIQEAAVYTRFINVFDKQTKK